MLTRSVTPTPFGFRLTYALDGENYWTEYVLLPHSGRHQRTLLSRVSAWTGNLLQRLMAGS